MTLFSLLLEGFTCEKHAKCYGSLTEGILFYLFKNIYFLIFILFTLAVPALSYVRWDLRRGMCDL